MDKIEKYFKEGILFQVFHSERNFIIWGKIADEVEFLNKQTKEIKDLYSFIQSSAVTNYVLDTAKIYDKPNKNYPTRCILSFLELVKSKANNFSEIIETTNTISLLKKYNTSQELINSVQSRDSSLFPLEFYKYYKTKYDSSAI